MNRRTAMFPLKLNGYAHVGQAVDFQNGWIDDEALEIQPKLVGARAC
jgi:hypothetical protein